jgi:rhodanese-related sulfurtransferase
LLAIFLTLKGKKMKFKSIKSVVLTTSALSLLLTGSAFAEGKAKDKKVRIVSGVMEIAGISRVQDGKNTINPAFAKTSRPCPPFCIQPTHPFAPAAVDTVTELDVIHAVRDVAAGDNSILIIDARTPVWTTAKKGGKIPHSVNIPFNKMNANALAKDPMAVVDLMVDNFGVKNNDDVLDFSNAKTLYLYCNGLWCGQSPMAIEALLSLGYPESKLKYYRGGMNAWHSLGLSTTGK